MTTTYSMRQTPLLPILSVAALVYPIGSFLSPSQGAAGIVISVQRTRREDGSVKQEYLSIPFSQYGRSLGLLTEGMREFPWDICYLSRQPFDLFKVASKNFSGRTLRTFEKEWTDDVLSTLSNEMLRRAPIHATPTFLAASEQHSQVRKVFALALAGLLKQIGKATLWEPAGHRLPKSWHRGWDSNGENDGQTTPTLL